MSQILLSAAKDTVFRQASEIRPSSPKMRRPTVLIGFAEALAGPEVAWSLADAGFSIAAFARKGRCSALRHSRYVTLHEICPPEEDLRRAQSDLHELLKAIDNGDDSAQQVLFPMDDTAVWLCSNVEPSPRWALAGPRGNNALLALNKELQTRMALEAGFNVPLTTVIRTASDLLKYASEQSFPIILKPVECVPTERNKVAKGRNWTCANQQEVKRMAGEWKEGLSLLAQPFITGVGEGIFGLATSEGIRAWSAHRRLRMMNPQGSGSSACISQPVPAELRPAVERFIEKTAWQGLFMIELLRDTSGKVWFVELNGRPWGSMALSRRQGLEYPAWRAELAIDPNSTVGTSTSSSPGIVCRNAGRELMHMLFVLRGPTSKAQKEWPSFWTALQGVLRPGPGSSFYNHRPGDMKVFWADCYYTVFGNVFKSSR